MGTPEPVVGCADALAALDIAAVEPSGLDRLAASRAPADVAVMAHVAGCVTCAAEMARLREIATLLRAGLAPAPSPDLRARTLDAVLAVGRQRGGDAGPVTVVGGAASSAPQVATVVGSATGRTRAGASVVPFRPATPGTRRRTILAGLAAAAVVVLAVGASALVATGVARSELQAERDRSAQLAQKSAVALRLLQDPAAIRIPMSGPGGVSGVAVIGRDGYGGGFSGAVVAPGLPSAPAGSEYVCYVVVDGERRFVGRMAEDGTMHAWAGPLDAFAHAKPGSIGEYGVLLVPAGSGSVEGDPVMSGALQA